MRVIIFFSMVLLLTACMNSATSQDQTQSASNVDDTLIDKANIELKAEITPTPIGKLPMPVITNYGIYGVHRISDNVNEHGQHIPPYKEVDIYNIYWKVQPKPGDKVTVIPINFHYHAFEISIADVKKTTNEYSETCGSDKLEVFWNIQLDKLTDRSFFEMTNRCQ